MFKFFGCSTVACFFFFYTLYLMVSTSPTAIEIKPDVRQYIYPVARENVKINFENLHRIFLGGDDLKMDFVISELEMNAYLDEHFPPPEKVPLRAPYIVLNDDVVSFRVNVSFEDLKRFIFNRLKGVEMDRNLRDLTVQSEIAFRFTITVDVGILWGKKEYPYVYLAGMRIGMLPIPIQWLLGDYTNVINERLKEWVDESLSKAPFIVRGVDIRDGFAEIHIEARLTDDVIRQRRLREYYEGNAPLVRALERPWGCRFGCTEEEREAVGEFVNRVVIKGYQHYDDPKLVEDAMMILEGGVPRRR